MEPVFEQALSLLRRGEHCIMAVMYETSGSTPRKAGAKMLIQSDGTIFATIGGGTLEGEAIKLGHEALRKKTSASFEFDMTSKDVHTSDLICGGQGRVILCYITARDLPVFEALCSAADSGMPASYVLRSENSLDCEKWEHFCVYHDGAVTGAEAVSDALKKSLQDAAIGPSMHSEESDCIVLYVEALVYSGKVYLLGGGHVAMETAKVAHIAGFRTVVVEDRDTFITETRFPHAERCLIDSFSHMPELNIKEDDYIVILTRGHKFDRESLEWALTTPAGYIGMIGSRTKRNLIYAELMKSGVTRQRLDEVHSPIGIKIGGETPGEIAVSILAELISIRAKKKSVI